MRRAASHAPRLLLGGETLLGVSRGPRDRVLEITARYSDSETLAVTMVKALNAGAEGVLASPSARLRAALGELKQRVPIYALLPNLPQMLREASEAGWLGAVLERIGRASPPTVARLCVGGLGRLGALLRGDLCGTAPLLLELEADGLSGTDLRGVVLAAALTDLALAGCHREFFDVFGRFARGRFGVAGLETHNLGHLLRRLREWGIRPDFVVGAINPRGLLMKPDVESVVAEMRVARFPVLAKESRAAGSVPLREGARYARELGAHGIVVDLAELEDLTTELRALRA